MLNPVYCSGCGLRLAIPPGHAKTKLRCAECGVFNEIPREVLEALAANVPNLVEEPVKPQAAPVRPKAVPEPEPEENDQTYGFLKEPAPPPIATPVVDQPAAKPKIKTKRGKIDSDDDAPREVLIQGTTDDDGNPYQVTGDIATRRCPECEKKVDARRAICGHCGYNFETKEKAERTFESIDREWEAGWPFQQRIATFAAFQLVNLVLMIASIVMGHGVPLSFVMVLMMVGLQAFLVGTYERLNLKRTERGKVTLLHTWRYAFIARPSVTIKWKEHEGVTVTRDNDFDLGSWVCAFILFGYACVPGILFWWFVIRPDKFTVTLCKDHGTPATPLFLTANQDRAHEIMEVVSDITTLPIQK